MGKCIIFFIAGLSTLFLSGCCSNSTSAATCFSDSAQYFWDIVATPVHSEKAVSTEQCYQLQVALKEKTSGGQTRTVVNLPPMSARLNDPVNIHIDNPNFHLDGCVSVQKDHNGDIIRYTYDARKKGISLKGEQYFPVKRS